MRFTDLVLPINFQDYGTNCTFGRLFLKVKGATCVRVET